MNIKERIKENISEHIYEHEINVEDIIDDIMSAIGSCESCEHSKNCQIYDYALADNKDYCSDYKPEEKE